MTDEITAFKKIKDSVPDEVTIVAASKTQSIDRILNLASAYPDLIFGENRVQELVDKYTPSLKWHLIGQLQTNKVKYIIDKVECIQSLDRMSLALEIEKCAEKKDIVMPCLIEINIGGEQAKGGLKIEDTGEFLKQLEALERVKPVGLMTVAPISDDEGYLKECFLKMKDAYDKFKDVYGFKYLSMGMSSDYKIAVECGSNMVRLGRTIFGDRLYV